MLMVGGLSLTGTGVAHAEGMTESTPYSTSDFDGANVLSCDPDAGFEVYERIHNESNSSGSASEFVVGLNGPTLYIQTTGTNSGRVLLSPGDCVRIQIDLINPANVDVIPSLLAYNQSRGLAVGIADLFGNSYTDPEGSHPLQIPAETTSPVILWFGRPKSAGSASDNNGDWAIQLDANLIIHKYYAPNAPLSPTPTNNGTLVDLSGYDLVGVPGVTYRAVPIYAYCTDNFDPNATFPAGCDDWIQADFEDPAGLAVWAEGFSALPYEDQIAAMEYWKDSNYAQIGTTDNNGELSDWYYAVPDENGGWTTQIYEGGELFELLVPLSMGLFYIEEIYVPPGVAPGAPFFITMPQPAGAGWNYNVHAYPKNEQFGIRKAVFPTAFVASETVGSGDAAVTNYTLKPGNYGWVPYTLTVPVPKIDDGSALASQAITEFVIRDVLDPHLAYSYSDNWERFGGWFWGVDSSAPDDEKDWGGSSILSDLGDDFQIIYNDTAADYCYSRTSLAIVGSATSDETDCVGHGSAGTVWVPANGVVLFLTDDGLATLTDAAQHQGKSGDIEVRLKYVAYAVNQGELIPNGGNLTDEFTTSSTALFLEIDGKIPQPKYSNVVTVSFGGKTIWKYSKECALKSGYDNENELAVEPPTGDDCTLLLPGATFVVMVEPTLAARLAAWVNSGHDVRAEGLPSDFYAGFLELPEQTSFWGWSWGGFAPFYNMSDGDGGYLDPNDGYMSDGYDLVQAGDCDGNDGSFIGCPWTVTTTDENGRAYIAGLTYGTYYLVEVEFPEGYAKHTPISPIEIAIDSQLDDEYFAASTADDMFVQNSVSQNAGFPFPITGGASSIIYALIAGVIVAGTLYVTRRQKNPATA